MRKALMWVKLSLVLPMIWLTAIQSKKESFHTRFNILKHWCKLVVKVSGIKLQVEGVDKIPTNETLYYVANHQGSLDPFIIVATLPSPATAVSKIENAKIPVLGPWFKNIEAIMFDRSNVRSALQMVKDVAANLKDGRNVVIFPEGTRSKGMEMGEMKPGAFKPAFLAEATIIPVTLVNTYVIDVKGKVDMRAKTIYMDPIRFDEYKDMSTTELAEKVKGLIQENLDRGL